MEERGKLPVNCGRRRGNKKTKWGKKRGQRSTLIKQILLKKAS